jgi:hypothetical protein
MSESFKLELINNHLVAYIFSKLVLIDTGCEDSAGNFTTSTWGTINRPGGVAGGTVSLKTISDYVGYPLDGLLGMGLLETVNFTINLKEERLTIFKNCPKSKGGVEIPLDQFLRVPVIPVCVDGIDFKAFADLGAQISYMPDSLVEGLVPIRVQEDFHPMAGRFTTPIYRKEIVIGGDRVELEVGVLPSDVALALSFSRIPIILGLSLLQQYEATFVFTGKEKRIVLRRFEEKESEEAI